MLLAPDDCSDSPDTDLCSSSDGGEMGSSTRDSSDNDRSSGEPIIMQKEEGITSMKSKVNSRPYKSKCLLLHLPTGINFKLKYKVPGNTCAECSCGTLDRLAEAEAEIGIV